MGEGIEKSTYTHICMHIHMYIRMHTHVHADKYQFMHAHTCMHACTRICITGVIPISLFLLAIGTVLRKAAIDRGVRLATGRYGCRYRGVTS